MDSFEVENFRSLKHLKLEKLARVNLLVGKNNSGKTSVLEALYTLICVETPHWFEDLESMRGMDENEQDFSALFYNLDNTLDIEATASYREAGTGPRKYRFQLGFSSDSPIRLKRKERRLLFIRIWVGAKSQNYLFAMTRTKDEVEYHPRADSEKKFLEEGLPAKMALRHTGTFLTTTLGLEKLSEELSDLIINKEESALIEIIRQIDSRIISFSLDSKGKIFFNLEGGFQKLSPINLFGEGVQRLLSIVAAIATTLGGIVLIDEIDNGLHYSALRILWKAILRAARQYDVQVFATTHSAEALRHLTWVLDDEDYKDYRNDVAAYTLIRAKDDTVRSFRYDYEQLDFAMEHDMEVRN